MMSYYILDIILLAPILYGLVRGLFRGLVQELTAIVAIIAALICSKIWVNEVSQWLKTLIDYDEQVITVVAYLAIFIAVALTLHFVALLLSKLLSAIALGWVNRLAGAAFGAAKWLILVSLLVNVFDYADQYFQIIKPEMKHQSFAYEPVKKVAGLAWDEIKEQQIIPTKNE